MLPPAPAAAGVDACLSRAAQWAHSRGARALIAAAGGLLRVGLLGAAFWMAAQGVAAMREGRQPVRLLGFARSLSAGLQGLAESLLGQPLEHGLNPAAFSGLFWFLLAAPCLYLAVERWRPCPVRREWGTLGLGLAVSLTCTLLCRLGWELPLLVALPIALFCAGVVMTTARLDQKTLSAAEVGRYYGARVLLFGAAAVGQLVAGGDERLWPALGAVLSGAVIVAALPPLLERFLSPSSDTYTLRLVRLIEFIAWVLWSLLLSVYARDIGAIAAHVALAALAALRGWRRRPLITAGLMPRRYEWVLLALTLFIAGFFRFHQLDAVPPGIHYDEACNGLEAIKILNGVFAPYTEVGNGKTTLFFYFIAAIYKVFGVSVEGMRATAALSGLACIVAAYLFARAQFGVVAALGAAWFLALSRWHITFSRIAFDAIQLPLFMFALFGFYFAAVGARRRWEAWTWALLCGTALSLNLYSYMAGRAVPLLFAVFLLLRLISERDFLRRHAVIAPLIALAFVAVSIPLYNYARQYPHIYYMRVDQLRLYPADASLEQKLSLLQHNAEWTLLQFDHRGDGNARHNIPDAPLLEPLQSLFGWLGLAYLLTRWRQPAAQVVLLWFAAMLAPGIMSIEAPQALRTLAALPAMAVAAGAALDAVWRVIAYILRGLSAPGALGNTRAANVLLAAALGAATLSLWPRVYTDYFLIYGRSPATWEGFAGRMRMIADYLRNEPATTHVYSDSTGEASLELLAPHIQWRGKADIARHLPLRYAPPAGHDTLFLVSYPHERPDVAWWVQYLYPEASVQRHVSPLHELQFITARIPSPAIPRHMGLTAQFDQLDDAGAVVRSATRIDAVLDFDLRRPPAPLERVDRVKLTGMMFSEAGPHVFELTSDGTAALRFDMRWLVDKPSQIGAATAVVELDAGLHGIEVYCVGASSLRLRCQQPMMLDYAPLHRNQLHERMPPEHGLRAAYWSRSRWEGTPLYVWIDPLVRFRWQITPGLDHFSARWEGRLRIDIPGRYRFYTVSNDYSRLVIDGQVVVDSGNAPQDHMDLSGDIDLEAGFHELLLEYADFRGYSIIHLDWRPPGKARGPVPSGVLHHALRAER